MDFLDNVDIDSFTNANDFLKEIRKQQQEQTNSFGGETSKINIDDINEENEYKEIETITNENSLRNIVKKLLKIENTLDDLNKKSKVLRESKSKLRTLVCGFMKKKEVDSLNLPDGGSFSYTKTKKTLNPFTKKRIPKGLYNYFIQEENCTPSQAEERRDKIIQFIAKHAEKVDSDTIRRSKKRFYMRYN